MKKRSFLFTMLLSAFLIIFGQLNAEAQNLGVQTTSTNCFGSCSGTAQITGLCPTVVATFHWSDNVVTTTPYRDGLCAGHYSVYVNSTNCLCITLQFDIWEDSPYFDVTQQNVKCNKLGSASVTAVYNAESPYHYQWSGPNGFTANTASINNLQPGSYFVTLTDKNGCTAEQYVEITVQQTIISVNSTVAQPGCNNTTGSITLNPTGGTWPYTYNWSNGSNAQNLTNLNPGNYTVTITDANGCVKTKSFVITPATPMTLSLSKVNTSCGLNNGSLNATITGGNSPFTITWLAPNGFTTTTIGSFTGIGSLSSGLYKVTATDASGCSVAAEEFIGSSVQAQDTTICRASCNPEVIYGIQFSQSGDTVFNELVNGCIREVSIHYTRLTGSNVTVNISACFGSPVNINGTIYTSNATVTVNANGPCLNTATYILTFGPAPTTTTLNPLNICGQKDTSFTVQNFVYSNGCVSGITLQQVNITKMMRDTVWGPERDTCGGAFDFVYIQFNGIHQTDFCKESVFLNLMFVKAQIVNTVVLDTIYDCGSASNVTFAYVGEEIDSLCHRNILVNKIVTSPIFSDTDTAWVCPGISYFWNVTGQFYTQGLYSDTTMNANGCPQYRNLIVFERQQAVVSPTLYFCPGDSVEYYGKKYGYGLHEVIIPTQSTEQCDTLAYLLALPYDVQDSVFHLESCKVRTDSVSTGFTINGCPYEKRFVFDYAPVLDTVSIDTCAFVVWPISVDTIHGDCDTLRITVFNTFDHLVLLYGNTCDQSLNGHQVHSVTTDAFGCRTDSVFTWIAWPVFNSTYTVTLCYGSSYDFYGQNLSVSGTYSKVFQTIHGCDSTISVVICIMAEKKSETNISICASDSTVWNGIVFYGANGSQDTTLFFQTVDNCDSSAIFHLGVNYSEVLQFKEFTCTKSEAKITETYYPSTSGGCGTLIIEEVVYDSVSATIAVDSIDCGGSGQINITTLSSNVTTIGWTYNGTPIMGSPSFVVAALPGNYSVKLSNDNGCTAELFAMLNSPDCDTSDCPIQITQYGNDRIEVRFNEEVTDGEMINSIFADMYFQDGTQVYQEKFFPNTETFVFDIDLANRPMGMFVLEIKFKIGGKPYLLSELSKKYPVKHKFFIL